MTFIYDLERKHMNDSLTKIFYLIHFYLTTEWTMFHHMHDYWLPMLMITYMTTKYEKNW